MSKTYIVQPSETSGGRLPYPYFADETGMVGRQDVWKGNPTQVIGFQADLAENQVDLLWEDAIQDLDLASGMHLVTAEADGNFSTHTNTVASVKEIRADSPDSSTEEG